MIAMYGLFMMAASIAAISVGLAYFIAKLLLRLFKEPVLQLPSGIAAMCNSQKCKNPATIGLGYVVEALNRRQEYRFAPGEKRKFIARTIGLHSVTVTRVS